MTTWQQSRENKRFAPLAAPLTADVIVIGGGLTGALTAYLLARAGKKITLFEKGLIGSGATGLTTAFLTQVIDTDLADLHKLIGHEGAATVLASHGAAIDLIEKIIIEEKIDCEFIRCSNFIYTNKEKDVTNLRLEMQFAQDLGLPVDVVKNDQALGISNSGYFEIKNQAKFHPLKFLDQLVIAAEKRGAQIFEETAVSDLDKETMSLRANGHLVSGEWIISATYQPFGKPPGLFFKKGQYDTYILELALPSGQLPEAIYEDTANPYHYFRVDHLTDHDRVIIGGEDHRSDIPVDKEKSFAALERYTRSIFESDFELVRRWSGPIIEPVDGLAYIGPYGNDRIIYTTGYSGNGMTYAGIASMIIKDLICDHESEWEKLYQASRTPSLSSLVVKGRDYFQELWNGAVKNSFRPYRH